MTDTAEIPKAPRGLKPRGRTFWKELHAAFDLTQDPHRRVIAEDACREIDLIDRLQKIVDDAEDIRVRGSQGQPVAMPELAELRQHRALLSQLLARLALPDTEELAQIKQTHLSEVRRQAAFVGVQKRNGG